ncbi:hypothetical protein LOTGIDRAFT_156213 [Lottia gigantea]|uniref:G-protein coupled receptors family 2 profile 1 domain-containing protein n=1 Tax=Lottia gigantea TaxID=225164 RepID=V4BBM1_LOTGI|nr:hypothetical protein LOTGIDRAFT_156213 [Lottia gigantea]ESP04966.1 hypothetical protein LOTGIDRAFT_156213 [Lottia gigantea]
MELVSVPAMETESPTCRYKLREYSVPDYNDFTCGWCHFYLFQRKSFAPSSQVPFLMATVNGSTWTRGRLVKPDPTNKTSVNIICESLNSDECDRWKMCCQSARECCRDQIAHPPVTNSTCAGTWDGYGCWRDANPDTENYLSCPNFLQHTNPTKFRGIKIPLV